MTNTNADALSYIDKIIRADKVAFGVGEGFGERVGSRIVARSEHPERANLLSVLAIEFDVESYSGSGIENFRSNPGFILGAVHGAIEIIHGDKS